MSKGASARTILVVDDEHALADTLATILERAGYRSVVAYGAAEALSVLGGMRPDLIISDVMMPGMNGVDFAVQACKLWPGVKVLLISGHAGTKELVEAARNECLVELLPKPVRPAEMLSKVAETLAPGLAASKLSVATAERAKCTVLLIDDEQQGLLLRKRVLESAGFQTLTTRRADEALELFSRHDVGVVITDHLLGRETAAEMAQAMKRLKPHTPIISLSGITDTTDAPTYADQFIGKSEGPEALITALDRILKQKPLAPRTDSPLKMLPAELPPQQLLAAIVADSSDAILSKTLDGIITSWNHAAETMYGYTREEAVGQPVTMLLPPDRPDEINHIMARLKRGERIFHFETVRVSKDGRRLDVSLTISPLRDSQGRLLGASTIARDITTQKSAEEALQKAEKLALAGRMTATLAHEINNPLEAISNILYLLRNTVELSIEARKYVDAAGEELERVSEITRLTLGMQRGGSERNAPVQLTTLLENVLTLYQRRSTTLGIEVTRDYSYRGTVLGCSGELRQVFSNLIVNAMDALAVSGDKLALSVHRARRWGTGEQGVRVSVLDNGPGIAREQRLQLFQAFYTTKGEQGTGIGLWVSHSIVRNHGGTLRVRSSVRQGRSGTCFSVFLPLKGPERKRKAA